MEGESGGRGKERGWRKAPTTAAVGPTLGSGSAAAPARGGRCPFETRTGAEGKHIERSLPSPASGYRWGAEGVQTCRALKRAWDSRQTLRLPGALVFGAVGRERHPARRNQSHAVAPRAGRGKGPDAQADPPPSLRRPRRPPRSPGETKGGSLVEAPN